MRRSSLAEYKRYIVVRMDAEEQVVGILRCWREKDQQATYSPYAGLPMPTEWENRTTDVGRLTVVWRGVARQFHMFSNQPYKITFISAEASGRKHTT